MTSCSSCTGAVFAFLCCFFCCFNWMNEQWGRAACDQCTLWWCGEDENPCAASYFFSEPSFCTWKKLKSHHSLSSWFCSYLLHLENLTWFVLLLALFAIDYHSSSKAPRMVFRSALLFIEVSRNWPGLFTPWTTSDFSEMYNNNNNK